MRAEIIKRLVALRANYWFIPAVMTIGAALLAIAAIWADRRFNGEILVLLGWERGAHPDGARQMLTVIAGSMIAVASTVFSITIAAVVFASGQFGPRLLDNFLSDTGNKIALGTFIATFLYSLLVLRVVQSPGIDRFDTGFVPNLAVLIAVVLAVISVMVLIFFLNHAPSNIRITHVIAVIGKQALEDIDKRFPNAFGEGEQRKDADARLTGHPVAVVRATKTGYIQIIDEESLFDAARQSDSVITLRTRPGQFIHKGVRIADIYAVDAIDEKTIKAVIRAFASDDGRTAAQDLEFLLDELVEIALRGLSPGINDPFTAMAALNWMAAIIAALAARDMPASRRTDEDGKVRVVVLSQSFESYVSRTFGAVRQSAATNTEAAVGQLRAIASSAAGADGRHEHLSVLRKEAACLVAAARLALGGPDLERVLSAYGAFDRALGETPPAMDEFDRDSSK